ncbi:DUF1345 domain-containing protein [Methylocystis sp. WRRC1]|uniref:DUF1345 domain-containing protein n=1 Tax=Methylocystis sp. WRRC1 TaxID=1732014 RepID=UPI001D15823E|nr:DUF1345 domain-containing protein [Methylocystis sp. WRRC1]MCC3244873.1 DUF1345 domain-containing protein [Methylocystis sp. WRRC1]
MSEGRDPATVRIPFRLPSPLQGARAHFRLIVCAAIGAVVGMTLPEMILEPPMWLSHPPIELSTVTRSLVGWNVAVILYLAAAARIVAGATREAIRDRAQLADEGRGAVLFLATAAACVAIGAIIEELGLVKSSPAIEKAPHILLAVITVVNSWLFMHLIFAFHYAHEYYFEQAASPERKRKERGGLIFPGENAPLYLDFLYFSYVIGVACQTGDVATSSPTMRMIALLHGVLAFFYNTTILALAVNIASGFV